MANASLNASGLGWGRECSLVKAFKKMEESSESSFDVSHPDVSGTDLGVLRTPLLDRRETRINHNTGGTLCPVLLQDSQE